MSSSLTLYRGVSGSEINLLACKTASKQKPGISTSSFLFQHVPHDLSDGNTLISNSYTCMLSRCYNHATHRDADTGDGVTAHSPDLKVAQSQRVCITDVFVENYMTLHGILSIGDKRNQKRGKKKNLFNFLQSLLGTNVEHEIRQLKESPPCDLGQWDHGFNTLPPIASHHPPLHWLNTSKVSRVIPTLRRQRISASRNLYILHVEK